MAAEAHSKSMTLSLIIKWGGQEFPLSALSEEDTVLDLKHSLKSLTGVLPERQKLLGLKYKGELGSWPSLPYITSHPHGSHPHSVLCPSVSFGGL